MRSGRFHGDKLRGGMGGDQDLEFAGLIRRVKVSSLTNVTEMSGATGVQSKDLPAVLINFSEELRGVHWRWRGRVWVIEGFVGRKMGRGSWRGERSVCIKYSISSRLGLQLNWVRRKDFRALCNQTVENSLPIWKLIRSLRNKSPSRSNPHTTRATYILRKLDMDGIRAKKT